MTSILPRIALTLIGPTLAACMDTTSGAVPVTIAPPTQNVSMSVGNFSTVVKRVEPVAERECRTRRADANCDFQIVVDDRPSEPANAYQTLDRNGRPVVVFTRALISETRNQDELAFILGHETAHHIQGHIPKTQQSATAGALILGVIASLGGAGQTGVDAAQNIGATIGARRYSKGYELDADRLGTLITIRAGYDPVKGAEYFNRIPDPGNQFLGTHPPNAERIQVVHQTAAEAGY